MRNEAKFGYIIIQFLLYIICHHYFELHRMWKEKRERDYPGRENMEEEYAGHHNFVKGQALRNDPKVRNASVTIPFS